MNLFVSALKNNEIMGVFKFDNKDDLDTHFFDTMYNNGYILKTISEEEYNNWDYGDEMTIEDIHRNYR